ncbi:hypothetical protein D1007_18225 [Hordeum vulgare]|uniref:FAF domain-containing protein n=1 Tax=Hordeum vulgare subsp. vulgare TaxID=112509 RepID=A0A8I6XAU6_HORVV|nr:protein FAF-like, chloroplastic [Hordeum vulgare subsp. vulgare]KAE8805720.1 hypothetical protein D1007_18225 [Hordeum vulgare]
MAADGGLRRLFEKPLPENPTLLEALSAWNRVHPKRPVDTTSFTEIFGELHFQEKQQQQQQPDHVARGGVLPPPRPPAPPPVRAATASPSSWIDVTEKSKDDSSLDALLRPSKPAPTVKRSASFSMKKSPSASSLLLCTEGLGSESTVDVLRDDDDELAAAFRRQEESRNDTDVVDANEDEKENQRVPPSFPPPIRSISVRGGKPSVCFRSFRAEGRFVLVEVVIPGKELLRASREGGRLRLQFASATAHA